MIEFLLALLIVVLLVAGMSIGVLLGRKPLSGSCGGMAALGMDLSCDICGGDASKCEEAGETEAGGGERERSLAYDAARPRR